MMRTPRRQRAYDLTEGRCTYCRARLVDDEGLIPCGDDSYVVPEGSEYLCVTLMEPRAAGGRATADNEVPACPRCSSLKGGMGHDAFLAKIAGGREAMTSPTTTGHRGGDTWMHLGEALPAAIARRLDVAPVWTRAAPADARVRSF